MLGWASQQFEKISQTVAPPPADANGRFVYAVQKGDEDGAMAAVPEMDAGRAVLNPTKRSYAIHMACQHSMDRLIRLLLNQPGVDLTFIDTHGNTPLHYATMSTDKTRALPTIKMLVTEFKASVVAKNSIGQTPYDLASLDMVRQFLLPLQLQQETQQAIDNGGVGLHPGIDMGGLRIANPVAPPPPIMSVAPAPMSSPAPHAYQHDPPQAPASGNQQTGYARTGGSSAAIYKPSGQRYVKADGFHSSSSDVSLQRKYGHHQTQYANIAPPPSSGNAGAAPPANSGPNPFAGGNNPYASGRANQRYVAYDAVTGQTSSAPRTAPPAYGQSAAPAYGQPAPATPNFAVFQPGGAPAPAPAVNAYNPAASGQGQNGTQQPASQSPMPQQAPAPAFQQQQQQLSQPYGQSQTQPGQQTPAAFSSPYGYQQQPAAQASPYGAQAPGHCQQPGSTPDAATSPVPFTSGGVSPVKADPNAAANLFSSPTSGGILPAQASNVFASPPSGQHAPVQAAGAVFGSPAGSQPAVSPESAQGVTGAFGTPAPAQNANNVFASPPSGEHTPVQSAGAIFGAPAGGQPAEAASNVFGAPAASQPAPADAGGVFGAPAITQPAPAQKTNSAGGQPASQSIPAQSAVGAFGAPTPAAGISQPTETASNVFGAPPSSQPEQSACGNFGQPTASGSQLLPEHTASGVVGALAGSQPVQAASDHFGAPATSQPAPAEAASNLFGAPPSSQAPAGAGWASGAPTEAAGNVFGAPPRSTQPAAVQSVFGSPPGSQAAHPTSPFDVPPVQSAGNAFGAPPALSAPAQSAGNVFGAQPAVPQSAGSVFGAPPISQPAAGTVQSPTGSQPAQTFAGGNIPPAPTSGGFNLADQGANSVAASDLFASPPSKGPSANGVPAAQPVENASSQAPTGGADSSNAHGNPSTPQAGRSGSPSGSEGCLDDVPLSPDGQPHATVEPVQNVGLAPAATLAPPQHGAPMQAPPGAATGAADLFSAIGMPPPPFSSKR